MGTAHARNQGLRRATGDYIAFLDGDDYLSDDALQRVVETFDRAQDIDCVLLHDVEFFNDSNRQVPYPMPIFNTMTGKEAFKASLTWQIHGIYVVKKQLVLRFPYDDSCRAYSDDNTTRLHYLNSRRVAYCTGTYFYRQHSRSTTHAVSMLRFDYIKANESMKRQLQQLHVDPTIMSLYETQRWLILIDTYMFYFHNRRQFSSEQRYTALSEMQRVWRGIETRLVDNHIKRKFGYMPCHFCWQLFRLQEEIYFLLRDKIAVRLFPKRR